ncbi:hypothetical protein B0H19DRAFT_1153790 [Mycena capillaripes]|nr:hypothetical protein B0H19DRAFT_1153790 [Mycena capillaripes]
MTEQPNWLSLPVEIWLHVLDLKLPLRDLAGLCLTCSQVLSITRPVLYHHLTLTAEKKLAPTSAVPNSAVLDTFSLLVRDPGLARSVRELTLDSRSRTESYVRNPGLIDVASLRNLTQLKRVTIIGNISRVAGRRDIDNFIQILHDLQLDELRLPAPGARPFIVALTPAQLAQLGNAKRIEFYGGTFDSNERLAPCVRTILAAARPSLTSLSLTARNGYLDVLFTLHFPLLRSLAIINTFDMGLACPLGFNAFLSTHHVMLQDLHLGYTDRRTLINPESFTPAAILFDTASGLHADFLPNLQVFRGHSMNVAMMARAGLRCLARLKTLTLGSALVHTDLKIALISDMLDAIETAGRLDTLRTLDFDLFQWDEKELDIPPNFVKRFAALCGSTLEVWRGLLPFAGLWPLDVFTEFPRLRVIYFPSDSSVLKLSGSPPDTDEESIGVDFVRRIAGTCNFEEVNIVSSMVREEEQCWKVCRSASGLAVRCLD